MLEGANQEYTEVDDALLQESREQRAQPNANFKALLTDENWQLNFEQRFKAAMDTMEYVEESL